MSGEDDQELSLAVRLARLWTATDRTAFYAVMVSEGVPQLRRIVSSGLNLQVSDAEDCVAEALEAFIERQDGADIADPYAYLARSAWNRGATIHRRRRHELVRSVEALSTPGGVASEDLPSTGSPQIRGTWAVIAVEESLGDVEAEKSWAVVVVEAALERLTAKQQALLRYLSTLQFDFSRKDFDVQSQVAAAALGMKPAAFRKSKQRAYEALRVAIVTTITELAVRPPARFVAAFEEPRGTFMADEPDQEEG